MLRTLAVTDVDLHAPTKRDLLLFDSLGVVQLDEALAAAPAHVAADLEWLAKNNLVTNATFEAKAFEDPLPEPLRSIASNILRNCLVTYTLGALAHNLGSPDQLVSRAALRRLAKVPDPPSYIDVEAAVHSALRTIRAVLSQSKSPAHLVENARIMHVASKVEQVRSIAVVWRRDGGTVAAFMPVSGEEQPTLGGEAAVLDVVLHQLPMPDDSTPWERVLEFRQDEDAVRSLRRLQRWMTDPKTVSKPAAQVEEELMAMLDDYCDYMKIHEMRSSPTSVEAIVVTLADVLENAVRLKLGAAAKAIFEFRRRRIALLEAEREAPGREVAYIVAAKRAFGSGV